VRNGYVKNTTVFGGASSAIHSAATPQEHAHSASAAEIHGSRTLMVKQVRQRPLAAFQMRSVEEDQLVG
jgi:hypothetical protein